MVRMSQNLPPRSTRGHTFDAGRDGHGPLTPACIVVAKIQAR